MSKRRSEALGFISALRVYGISWSLTSLQAIAKDLPKASSSGAANPDGVVSTQHKEVNNLLSGLAMTLCVKAVSIGSFTIGALCGLVLIVGILHHRNDLIIILIL
jgi:hypothetical protein